MHSERAARPTQAGFTLIELVIVILIIGLLVSAAVVGTNLVRQRARDTRRASDVQALQKAFSIYLANTGLYPAAPGGVCLTDADAVSVQLRNNGTVTRVPTDPLAAWANDPSTCYRYTSADGNTYTFRYTLEISSQVGAAGDHTVVP